jgi:histone deacetylase 11
MRHATGSTVLACRLALEHGIAINLGGGYHHAASGRGDGFCVYADVPVAGKVLHDEGKVGRVLVATFRVWPWASILDIYEEDIFPARKEPEDYPLSFPPGLTGGEYLEIVEEALPKTLDAVRPDLGVYNAGSDPFVDDPLAWPTEARRMYEFHTRDEDGLVHLKNPGLRSSLHSAA